MVGDNGLLKGYHLDGVANFGVSAYHVKNLLQKEGRIPIGEEEWNANKS